jgi:ribosome-binding factor A
VYARKRTHQGSPVLKHRRTKESQLIDPDFAEALYEGESHSLSSGRQAQRKARQFCRQVQRALNLALSNDGIFVEEVSPAPDCGRLLVHVILPDGRPVADAIAALRRDTPRLRAEVAMAITRKRAPDLFFVPACPDGESHE